MRIEKYPEYDFQRFSRDYIQSFVELFSDSFGKVIDGKKVLDKYDTASFGASYIGYIVFHEERPIAYYGVIPFTLNYEGEEILVAQSADTMTHPQYQGKGLFTTLARMTFELAAREGVKFIYGWPNQNSYYGFKNKLNWDELGNMQVFRFPVMTLPLAKASWKLKALRPLYDWYSARILNLLTRSTSDVLTTPEGTVMRNSAYLTYKKNLGSKVRAINDSIVWMRIDYRLKVGDLQMSGDFDNLWRKLKKLSFWLGITDLEFIVAPGSKWYRLLSEAHPSEDHLPLMYLLLDEKYLLGTTNFTGGDYDTF